MLVNNKKIAEFGARLLTYSLGGSAITNDYLLAPNSRAPVLLNSDVGLRPLSITLTFEGEDREDTVAKISAFAAQVQSKSEIWLPDGFTYACILTSISEAGEILPSYQEVSYTFDAVQHKELRTFTYASGTSHDVFCEGNLPADCVLTVTLSASASNFTLFGINLGATVPAGTYVIDGMKRTVTRGGINYFGSTDLVEFPKLSPGVNRILLSKSAPLTVSYYPTFL